ncbi:MAG: hypothetical protein NC089_01715 [Bacteroides sp.]|nr:hypothetical protein [Bacteroides sp.]MCM1548840.1 hypothetical protein [Clostridium sp.]
MSKRVWLGQRLSDGMLFSRALHDIESYFTCESLVGNQLPTNCFSLDEKGILPDSRNKWVSTDIKKIIDIYEQQLNDLLDKDSILFPYYLSNESIIKLRRKQSVLNEKVFRSQLVRSLQMFMMNQANIVTPKWIIPNHLSWETITNTVGCPFIIQFDNTSSGMGTYLINSKTDYLFFVEKYGEADIATQYISDGYSCSTHIWVTANDIQITSSSIQLVEKNLLTGEDNSIQTFLFRGNDFGLYDSKVGKYSNIKEQLFRIGSVYQKAGIWGLIGVDYIIKDGIFFYNETNFRLQNSTSLLSYFQPQNNNIIGLMLGRKTKLAKVRKGFQYFVTLNVPLLLSGYYSDTGEFISDFDASCVIDSLDKYLVFVSSVRNGLQDVRIIGLDAGQIKFGHIGSNVSKFVERLVDIYG